MPFYIGVPVRENDRYTLQWDTAYTFQAEPVSYTFELAGDHTFKNPIVKTDDLKLPMTTFDLLPPGQYFVRVIAKDAGGQTQTAFDSYMIESGKVYGTKCFYVDQNGQIVEDVYVE